MEEDTSLDLRDRYLGKEIVEAIIAPTPKDLIYERPLRGGKSGKYVAGSHFIRKLNDCFGFLWSYEVPKSYEDNGQVVAIGRLTALIPVPIKKGTRTYIDSEGRKVVEEFVNYERWDVVKEQFGSSEVKKYAATVTNKSNVIIHKKDDVIDLGDDFKAAATDAMKKCATELGIFLDVYESQPQEKEGAVTKRQLETFYMRAGEAGMDEAQAIKWGEEQIGKPVSEWEPLDAMGLIPPLIDLAKSKKLEILHKED